MDLRSDEQLAQLMDRGSVADWASLRTLALADPALRRRMRSIVERVEIGFPGFRLALLASMGEPVDWDRPLPKDQSLRRDQRKPAAAVVMKRLAKAALASGVRVAKAKTPGVADVPVHQLTIETNAGTVRLSFDDLALPKSLKPLVAFLARRSKPM